MGCVSYTFKGITHRSDVRGKGGGGHTQCTCSVWLLALRKAGLMDSMGSTRDGMACKLRLMYWLMSLFQPSSGWSRRINTISSSAMVLLSEAVEEAWSLYFLIRFPMNTNWTIINLPHYFELQHTHTTHTHTHTHTHTPALLEPMKGELHSTMTSPRRPNSFSTNFFCSISR